MNQQEQIDLAKRLQGKLLDRFDKLLDDGELTASDAQVLTRLLMQSGWELDESRLPQSLKDKLTVTTTSFDEDLEGDNELRIAR